VVRPGVPEEVELVVRREAPQEVELVVRLEAPHEVRLVVRQEGPQGVELVVRPEVTRVALMKALLGASVHLKIPHLLLDSNVGKRFYVHGSRPVAWGCLAIN